MSPFICFVHQGMESPDRDQIDRYITSSVKSAFVKVTFLAASFDSRAIHFASYTFRN